MSGAKTLFFWVSPKYLDLYLFSQQMENQFYCIMFPFRDQFKSLLVEEYPERSRTVELTASRKFWCHGNSRDTKAKDLDLCPYSVKPALWDMAQQCVMISWNPHLFFNFHLLAHLFLLWFSKVGTSHEPGALLGAEETPGTESNQKLPSPKVPKEEGTVRQECVMTLSSPGGRQEEVQRRFPGKSDI